MDTLKGFARYSLNRDNQLHKCTCHGVHSAAVALSGVLREQSPVEDSNCIVPSFLTSLGCK